MKLILLLAVIGWMACQDFESNGLDAGGQSDRGEGNESGDQQSPIPCDPNGLCPNDTHCVDGFCLPWQEGEFDPQCKLAATPGPVRPNIQCRWQGPPEGDPEPTFSHVLHTPLVANFGVEIDMGVPSRPWVVFVSDNTYRESSTGRRCSAAGILRLIDGATCREIGQATDPADRVNSSVTPAIGDLDGDGLPEIVAAGAGGGLIAFGWDTRQRKLIALWKSTLPDQSPDLQGSTECLWGGITLSDLTNDGLPEVMFDGGVWSPTGMRLATVSGWAGYHWGVPAVVADIDLDNALEMVAGEGVWEWKDGAFVPEPDFTDPGVRGFTAIADFGEFKDGLGDAPGRPEIVVVGNKEIVVLSVGGTVLRRQSIESEGGGPPTLADFDGDEVPEVGAAFGSAYVVYDVIDGKILWQQTTQDKSSARTGSSLFDFNGDKRAEVIYGDECFVRVFDGPTGEVIFSQARFSSTWEENPIVADVDGDYAAEMVMGMSGPCNPGSCPEWDPLFSGLRCDQNSDCPSNSCGEGLCRCTEEGQCGDTYGCSDPLPNTGSSKVCRAKHADCVPELRIYRDARDRWASSLPIWNQHAYHVTNINPDGTVPRSDQMKRNWQESGLNNFRQNVQGELVDIPRPDLTMSEMKASCEYGATTRMSVKVCNRGAALGDIGLIIIFREVGGGDLCSLLTDEPIPPGKCVAFGCLAEVSFNGEFEAVVDPELIVNECIKGNNTARAIGHCQEI